MPATYDKQLLHDAIVEYALTTPNISEHRRHQTKILAEFILHEWTPRSAQLLSGVRIPGELLPGLGENSE